MRNLAVSAPWRKVGMASPQFETRYRAESRSKEEIAAFLHQAMEEWGGGDE